MSSPSWTSVVDGRRIRVVDVGRLNVSEIEVAQHGCAVKLDLDFLEDDDVVGVRFVRFPPDTEPTSIRVCAERPVETQTGVSYELRENIGCSDGVGFAKFIRTTLADRAKQKQHLKYFRDLGKLIFDGRDAKDADDTPPWVSQPDVGPLRQVYEKELECVEAMETAQFEIMAQLNSYKASLGLAYSVNEMYQTLVNADTLTNAEVLGMLSVACPCVTVASSVCLKRGSLVFWCRHASWTPAYDIDIVEGTKLVLRYTAQIRQSTGCDWIKAPVCLSSNPGKDKTDPPVLGTDEVYIDAHYRRPRPCPRYASERGLQPRMLMMRGLAAAESSSPTASNVLRHRFELDDALTVSSSSVGVNTVLLAEMECPLEAAYVAYPQLEAHPALWCRVSNTTAHPFLRSDSVRVYADGVLLCTSSSYSPITFPGQRLVFASALGSGEKLFFHLAPSLEIVVQHAETKSVEKKDAKLSQKQRVVTFRSIARITGKQAPLDHPLIAIMKCVRVLDPQLTLSITEPENFRELHHMEDLSLIFGKILPAQERTASVLNSFNAHMIQLVVRPGVSLQGSSPPLTSSLTYTVKSTSNEPFHRDQDDSN